jgi:hypothetical protein
MLFKFRKNLKTVQNKNYDTYDADEKNGNWHGTAVNSSVVEL